MHRKLDQLEAVIWEYRKIAEDLFEMRHDIEHEVSFCDPSDEFIKERELEEKFKEIRNLKWDD